MKRIVITLSKEKCEEFYQEVGEIVGIATYLEAQVEIRDAPLGRSYGSRLTECA